MISVIRGVFAYCIDVGTEFLYSSHTWTLLSAVVEGASGRKFTDVMVQIFRDLGLDNTYLDEDKPIIPHRSRYMLCNLGWCNITVINTLFHVLITDNIYCSKVKQKNKSLFSLVNLTVNIVLPAFAAEHRAAALMLLGTWFPPLSIDISCPHGAQQQTHCMLLWSNDETDGHADGWADT